ncbi:MAG: ankyrin repeat domain-containing protein [Candidatus Thiodiazotropha endolucinida]
MIDQPSQKESLQAYFHEAAVDEVFKRYVEPALKGADEDEHGNAMKSFAPDASGLEMLSPALLKRYAENPTNQEKEDLLRTIMSLGQAIEDTADEMISLRNDFMTAAKRGNAKRLKAIMETGFPVNYQDPVTGETALHISAGCQARKTLRVLLKFGRCDFLLRDKQGRLASELAYLYGRDPAVARLLGIKERKQADANGIRLTRRPKDK